MMKADKLIASMRRNPAGDWTIADVQRLCGQLGWHCFPPSSGSHWKVAAPGSDTIIVIPAKRPIKAIYIKRLIDLVDEVGTHGTGY